MNTIEARARRGAVLLDLHVPGWAQRINEEELDLGSCRDCILGQVFGEYYKGKEKLGIKPSCSLIYNDALMNGFDVAAVTACHAEDEDAEFAERPKWAIDAEYAALAAAWLVEIKARLEAAEDEAEEAEHEALLLHNESFDRWERMTDRQRDDEIALAMQRS